MFKRVKISTKLRINATIVAVGLSILGIISYSSINNLQESYKESNEINNQMSHYKSVMIGGLLVNSASGVYAFNPVSLKPINAASKGLEKVKTFSKKIKNKDEKFFNNFILNAGEVLDFAKKNQFLSPEHVKKVLKNWRPLKFYMQDRLKVLTKEQKAISKTFKESLNNLLYQIVVVIILVTLVVLLFGTLISRGIIESLALLEDSVKSLASGKSTQKVVLKNHDETESIANYMNQYMDNIEKGLIKDRKVINEVKDVIEKINSGLFNTIVNSKANSKEVNELVEELNKMIKTTSENLTKLSDVLINYGNSEFDKPMPNISGITGIVGSLFLGIKATGNNVSELLSLIDNSNSELLYSSKELSRSAIALSDASSSQAASLEETAAAIEEVTSTITSSTKNTIKMDSYAKEVTTSVNNGKELASQTTKAMDDINNEVSAINEAITVIDQISFQTNILSLNAAVEAATAGEAGKGFAVVAQEVRNLASRSAEAANEIKTLVENAAIKANNGKSISDTMISGYDSLNKSIEKTIELIGIVATSSKDQQQAMVQINDAIAKLDQITQKNATESANISKMSKTNEQLVNNLQIAINRTSFDPEAKKRVCDVNMIFDTSKLKLNHIVFKNDCFCKAGAGERFEVKNEHQCALGDWIAKNSNQEFASSNDFKELQVAHNKVHKLVQKTVDIYSSANYENKDLFKVTDEVEKNINIVFNKLNSIREINCNKKRGS